MWLTREQSKVRDQNRQSALESVYFSSQLVNFVVLLRDRLGYVRFHRITQCGGIHKLDHRLCPVEAGLMGCTGARSMRLTSALARGAPEPVQAR